MFKIFKNQGMKKKSIILLFLLQTSLFAFSQCPDSLPESKWGWEIGVQTYSFKAFDFYTALNKYDSVGTCFIECYPGMRIGSGLKGFVDVNMSPRDRQEVASWLKKRKMRIVNYGVVDMKTEADWKKLFEFAKEFNIETLIVEPDLKFIPLLSSLCDKYKINIAIHNHAKPSYYWNPKTVLDAIKGYSKRLGACADIGHWVRSGLDPLECLKELDGRVLDTHMKDLNEKGNIDAHNVVLGEGVCNVPALIAELKRQQYKGMITIEYEYNFFNNVPDISKSITYLRALLK